MSKRDEARDAFAMWIVAAAATSYGATWDRVTADGIRSVVDLVIDAAKEEIRDELIVDRYDQMSRIIAKSDGPQTQAFWFEWQEVNRKREAAGKTVD